MMVDRIVLEHYKKLEKIQVPRLRFVNGLNGHQFYFNRELQCTVFVSLQRLGHARLGPLQRLGPALYSLPNRYLYIGR